MLEKTMKRKSLKNSFTPRPMLPDELENLRNLYEEASDDKYKDLNYEGCYFETTVQYDHPIKEKSFRIGCGRYLQERGIIASLGEEVLRLNNVSVRNNKKVLGLKNFIYYL